MSFIPQALPSNETSSCRRNDSNYETYFLIWLDAAIYSEENVAARKTLQSSISYLQPFDQLDECEKYIRSVAPDDRIVFIVSGHFGQTIVPEVSYLRQVSSIYICCTNKEFHQSWSMQYQKVISIFEELNPRKI